ncbi:flagellar biosynthetic protein FliS [Candidatus Regiella insecticola 5.15]|uniref:Flagellar secretion chaperone FliS n=1 Tax=Candidatus Regiella insecticola 5.15 TaxID=1005043 RepID=G2GZ96_9ENTR|nr:flagellar export chaperone FliS [Candidatus Regiella insecticola]EGY28941.1 flagellar biosynthetic protein FliS [Candidatus Regiella insecticola 5.15]
MYQNQDYRLYQQDDIAAQACVATSHQLVLMLFSALMDELIRIKSHIKAKRYEHKATSVNKCIDIINALTAVLDFDNGGSVAANLARLYDYCVYRLYDASNQLSIELIVEVEGIITNLYNGWQTLGKNKE